MQKKVFGIIKSSYFSYAIVATGAIFSLLIAWQSARWIEKGEEERFQIAYEQILFLAQRQLQNNVQMVCSSAAFFKASEVVTREDWKIYIDSHMLQKRFPSIELIGYAPVISEQMREEHEAKMHLEGLEQYTIFPAFSTNPLIPITYIEPLTSINAKALGFNSASEPMRKATLEKALERGVGTLSPKIEFMLEKEPEEKAGFIVFAPIFKKGVLVETREQKQANIIGYIIGGIKAKSLFEGLSDEGYRKIEFEVYDGTSMEMTSKLYDSKPNLTRPRYVYNETINLYGREWTFHFKANEVLDISWSRYVPFAQAFFGILFSLVVGRWLYALQRTREEAYLIAEEKTKLLARSEAEVRTVFQAMHEGVIVQNAEGLIVECNLAIQEIFGMHKEEMLGKTSTYVKWDAIHEDGSPFLMEDRPAPKALRTGQAQENVIMGIKRDDGKITWVQANAQPIFSDDFSHVESVVVTLSDITQFRKSKSKLQEYIALIDANVMISSTDIKGFITEVSEAFCHMSGYTKEELIGVNHNILRHSDTPASFYEQMWETLKSGKTWFGEMKNRHKSGADYWIEARISPRFDELGTIIGYTAVRHDITDKKRIEQLSVTDTLTGLYNRLKLDELLNLHISMAVRHMTPFSVIMLDIDKFKSVNDTYGHQVGDMLLQEIAHVLQSHIRLEDALGRWGGEEFLILLPATPLEGAYELAQKLREAIATYTFKTVGKRTSSFGVATYHGGDDSKTLVGRADEALYRAKEAGRNRVEAEIHTCELPA